MRTSAPQERSPAMKKYLLLSCFVSLFLFGCSPEESNIEKGVAAYNQHHYQDAYNYFLEEAQNNDNPDAELYLGKMYLRGEYVQMDTDKAGYWFQKAAAQDPKLSSAVSDAEAYLGFCYDSGLCMQQSTQMAMYYYQKSANEGSGFGAFDLGTSYLQLPISSANKKLAFKWLSKSADMGYVRGQAMLACACYIAGMCGVSKDYEKAYNLLLPGIQQKDAAAELGMGNMYMDGYYVKKDKAKGQLLLDEALAQGL